MQHKSLRILAISQVYYPDTASTSQHLTDLLEALYINNHNVSVLSSRRDYEKPKITFSKKETHNGVEIIRIKNTGFGKKNKFTRLIDFLSFNFLISFKLLALRTKEYDVIIGMTSPPLLSYIGLKIAKWKKIKFVYWTMDLQPELSIAAKYIKPNSVPANILHNMGDYIFKHSDKIITLDVYMLKHIRSRIGHHKKDIDVIPVWPVMNEVYNGLRLENPFRKKYNFGDKIVIMYSGNHSVMHPLTTLLKAAIELKEDKRFLFVHIGSGVGLQEVKQFKSDYELDNILILPYQPREIIHFSLGSADLQVVSLGDGCVGYTHPNKIYGSMFIGKPILYIGPKDSHITDILINCTGNIMAQHNQTNMLVEHLIGFANLREEQKNKIGNENKLYAEKHFYSSVLINQMVDSIISI